MPAKRPSPVHISADLNFLYRAEAESLGLTDTRGAGTGRLITADLNRFRRMAAHATPKLTERQWGLLSHVLDGAEFSRLIRQEDELPGRGEIAAEIMDWMRAGGSETSPAWARELYDQTLSWTPIAIAGIMLRLRAEEARKANTASL